MTTFASAGVRIGLPVVTFEPVVLIGQILDHLSLGHVVLARSHVGNERLDKWQLIAPIPRKDCYVHTQRGHQYLGVVASPLKLITPVTRHQRTPLLVSV